MEIQDLIEKYERLYEAVNGLSGIENMVNDFLVDLRKLQSENGKLPIPHVSGSLPLIQEAKDLVVRLLPPLEYGEDYDACRLYEILDEIEGNNC